MDADTTVLILEIIFAIATVVFIAFQIRKYHTNKNNKKEK